METWHSLNLGDGMMAPIPSDEIEAAFKRFAANHSSNEMAVFTRYESEGRLHCDVIAYFPPAAATLAEEFGAQPCAPPVRAGLGLLAGDERVWSLLFPDN